MMHLFIRHKVDLAFKDGTTYYSILNPSFQDPDLLS
jgi:hypothetical protein